MTGEALFETLHLLALRKRIRGIDFFLSWERGIL
jgi:hypothetical protein